MTTPPPAASEPEADDTLGMRYPNMARIWNYHLQGKDNFEIDRRAAEAVNVRMREIGAPSAAETAVETRHLLQRMVDYMLGRGIRQFLDLGSGLPNMANTHQIARRVASGARVVYVDIDPMVSAHAAALMGNSGVTALHADLREPEAVLGNSQVRDVLDFGQPIGIMFISMLHCLWEEEDPWGVVRQFRDAVVPGSHLALSHMTNEFHREAAQAIFQVSQDFHFDVPLISRSRADIARLFDGFTLVEPGLVTPAQWRPDLHNPLIDPRAGGDDDEPALKPAVLEHPGDDQGAAWHLCGIGIKDQH